jgi:hypothetical protein
MFTVIRNFFGSQSLALSIAGALLVAAIRVQATPLQLTYTGTFNTDEALNLASASSPTNFTTTTPFTLISLFDDSSPNLAPTFGGPFDGFRAYAPSSTTIEIGGTVYSVTSILDNPTAGVSVAIFDQNSFFPGRYGIGMIADPFGDGAGFVGDFTSASPNFVVSALTPTVFTDYYGVGHGSGVCQSGFPPACPHVVTPWVLRDSSNVEWNLTWGNYEEDYPVAHTAGASVGQLNTARITAVPEPASVSMIVAGLLALSATAGRRRSACNVAATCT